MELTTGTALFYILVFWTGYVLADINYDSWTFSAKRIGVFSLLIILMMFFRILLKVSLGVSAFYTSLVSIEHTVLGISIMLFFLEIGKIIPIFYEKIGRSKVVVFLDNMSFYIYLTHGIFCMGPTNVYSYFPLLVGTILFVIATLICARGVYILTNMITSRLFVERIV